MMRLHLIADDLTGALDTAAQFIGATGPIPVHWRGLPRSATVSSIAIDSGTREPRREEARRDRCGPGRRAAARARIDFLHQAGQPAARPRRGGTRRLDRRPRA